MSKHTNTPWKADRIYENYISGRMHSIGEEIHTDCDGDCMPNIGEDEPPECPICGNATINSGECTGCGYSKIDGEETP